MNIMLSDILAFGTSVTHCANTVTCT